jgi:glycosyltransferase involved in cell wall biosynthesis
MLRNRKVLLQLHGGVGPPPYKTSTLKLLTKRVYDASLGKYTIINSDIIASVSYTDLKYIGDIFSLPESRLKYVPNAINTELFKPPENPRDPSKKVLLYIGDLEPWKGVDQLIKWIQKYREWDGQHITFRFVGHGAYYHKLLSLQTKMNNNSNHVKIEVLGPRPHDEIPALMSDASALLFPSRWEGMPTVVLEAMATSLPVISTQVGDLRKLITHMETGVVIDQSFERFRDAVDMILEGGSKVSSIKKNARDLIVRDFTLKGVTRTLNAIYHEMIS